MLPDLSRVRGPEGGRSGSEQEPVLHGGRARAARLGILPMDGSHQGSHHDALLALLS